MTDLGISLPGSVSYNSVRFVRPGHSGRVPSISLADNFLQGRREQVQLAGVGMVLTKLLVEGDSVPIQEEER